MNGSTKISRIALFATGLHHQPEHPTLMLDLVTLDDAGRAPQYANGAERLTDADSPVCIYAASPWPEIPPIMLELIRAIDDREIFPVHRDEREQLTADAVSTLLEQATEAKIEWRHLHDELTHTRRSRNHIIKQAREWKAAYINAYSAADAVSRTLEYRERRADDALRAAQARENALNDREAALVKREQRAAHSVQQAMNRSNHSNELVEQARRDAASHKATARHAVDQMTTAAAELSVAKRVQAKIVEQARSWKQRALAAEEQEQGFREAYERTERDLEAAAGKPPIVVNVGGSLSAAEADALIEKLLAKYPEPPAPADEYRDRTEAWEEVFHHPALREFTQRPGVPIENVMNGITTLSERAEAEHKRAESARSESEEARNLIAAIAEELTPGRRDKDLVQAARHMRVRGISEHAKNRIHSADESVAAKSGKIRDLRKQLDDATQGAERLAQQLSDSHKVIDLRDADVDDLKAKLETAEGDLSQALEDRATCEWQLGREHTAHLMTYTHLRELTVRTRDAIGTISTTRTRRDSATHTALQHLAGAADIASQVDQPIDPQGPVIDEHGQPVLPEDARRSARRSHDEVNPFGNIIDTSE